MQVCRRAGKDRKLHRRRRQHRHQDSRLLRVSNDRALVSRRRSWRG